MDLLIVEDSLRERERLESLFTGLGYAIRSCDSVHQAEEYLRREPVRLAIIDIGLTDKSGSVLFQEIRAQQPSCQVVIFTGNPSPYLKQRFLKEGAVSYIVKGSEAATNEAFQRLVHDLIGDAEEDTSAKSVGTPLNDFLREHIPEESRGLFYDADGEFPPCKACGSREYLVTFAHDVQVPPTLFGKVFCQNCKTSLDLTVGDGDES